MTKQEKENGLYLGLMSGTSLDGLDVVAVQFQRGSGRRLGFRLVAGETLPYPEEWHRRLTHAYLAMGRELVQTHWEYGTWLGQQVAEFIQRHGLTGVVAVGSHGHTLFHDPDAGYTYQIGEGHALHEACGLPVVADFRSGNVARGGQGAPLVPYGDRTLFGQYAACINLGGFANISYEDALQRRVAYDVAACNGVLNLISQRMGFPYDENGDMARSGQPSRRWIEWLNDLPYYQATPPKSLGKEWIDATLGPFLESTLMPQDLLATYTRHLAFQLYQSLLPLKGQGNGEVLVTGGGAHNAFLIEETQRLLPGGLRLVVPEPALIDFKEALIFALLARQWVLDQPNCLGSATGVAKDQRLGVGYGF